MEVIHMVPFTVRERDQQIWLKGADASPLERGEVLTYYLNMDMRQLRKWSNDIRHTAVGLEAFHPNVGKYKEHINTMYRLQHEVLSFLKQQPVYAGVSEDDIYYVEYELQMILSQNESLLRGSCDSIEEDPNDPSLQEDWDALYEEMMRKFAEFQQKSKSQDAVNKPKHRSAAKNKKKELSEIEIAKALVPSPPCFELSEAVFDRQYQLKHEDRISEFNHAVMSNALQFEALLDDLIRVKEVYLPFLKEYQSGDKQKALQQLFEQYYSFDNRFQLNSGGQMKAIYSLGEDGKIYRETEYSSLGSFLYTELMTCLQENKVPRCCTNCGRFFMPRGGYDVEYCDNPAPGETDKTCKEVGARNTFARRVKDSPALQIFQRAYKTHHARIRSGHMTKETFAIWSARAMDLRDACLEGKITLEELETELTKDLMYKKG